MTIRKRAESEAEGLIKATGRIYHQDYVVFLRAFEGKIAFLREYFDPTRRQGAGHANSRTQYLGPPSQPRDT